VAIAAAAAAIAVGVAAVAVTPAAAATTVVWVSSTVFSRHNFMPLGPLKLLLLLLAPLLPPLLLEVPPTHLIIIPLWLTLSEPQ
jgi:hypothetical protein